MKSRKRERQKQSARLYLRNSDHRDAIYNDIYHNAMVWVDEEGKTHYPWIKYPKKAIFFLFTGQVSIGADRWTAGIIDVERQFCHAISMSGSSDRGVRVVGNFLLSYTVSTSSRQFYLTKDGSMFKQKNMSTLYYTGYYYPLGIPYGDDNSKFCVMTRPNTSPSDYFEMTVYEISKFDYEEVELTETKYTSVYTFRDWYYMKPTANGVMLFMIRPRSTSQTVPWNQIIEFTETGTNIINDNVDFEPLMGYPSVQANPVWYGNKIAFPMWVKSDGVAYWSCRYSLDNGLSWNRHEFMFYRTGYSSNGSYACRRGDTFYFFCVEKHDNLDQTVYRQLHIIKTTDFSYFQEIDLPDYCDVNVMWAGRCTESYPDTDKFRILLNSSADSGGLPSANIESMLTTGMNDGSGGIEIIDGEIQFIPEDEFLILVYRYGENEELVVYMDNMEFEETTNNFAFITPYDLYNTDGADPCIQEDYCVPYPSPTPFDPSQYAFWDYYKWNSEEGFYERVMRVDLKNYPNWHVIVIEYLPETGANNVIYKVPRYNV